MPAPTGMTVDRCVIPANAGISLFVRIQRPAVSEVLPCILFILSLEEFTIEAALPKEFHKNFFDSFDRHFFVILLISFIVHYGTIAYFVLNPLPVHFEQKTIKEIQDNYATLVLKKEAEATRIADDLLQDRLTQGQPPLRVSAGESGGERQGAGSAEGSAAGNNEANAGASGSASRHAQQARLERQLAGQGILAVLSGTSANARSDQTVQDVLGDGGQASRDFNKVFENIDRLSSSGAASAGLGGSGTGGGSGKTSARGGRATSSGTIQTSFSGLGEAQGGTPVKQTDLLVAELSPITEDGQPGGTGGALASGARDLNQVSAVVNSHSAAIQYCYERELKRQPGLKGKCAIRFTITPEGKVINPTILSSTLNSESVERCVLSRISRWDDFGSIDPSLGNATFRQVYTFGF
jgi:hypothetical protein